MNEGKGANFAAVERIRAKQKKTAEKEINRCKNQKTQCSKYRIQLELARTDSIIYTLNTRT